MSITPTTHYVYTHISHEAAGCLEVAAGVTVSIIHLSTRWGLDLQLWPQTSGWLRWTSVSWHVAPIFVRGLTLRGTSNLLKLIPTHLQVFSAALIAFLNISPDCRRSPGHMIDWCEWGKWDQLMMRISYWYLIWALQPQVLQSHTFSEPSIIR